MFKKLRFDIIHIFNNYFNILPIFDVAFRIFIALIFPNVFSKNDFTFYILFLNSIFWIQLFDLGNYAGFTLDKIINSSDKVLHFGQFISTFLFTIFLNLIIAIPVLTSRFREFNLVFLITILLISMVSLFSVIYRSYGYYLIDIKGKIFYSISLFLLLVFYKFNVLSINRLNIFYFIIIPYFFNLIIYFFYYNKLQIYYNFKFSLIPFLRNNIFKGFSLYIMNISLLSLSMLDKFVFSKTLSKNELSTFFLSLSISSIHIIFQNQVYNIFYNKLLSKNSTIKSNFSILIFSIIFNFLLSILIFLMYQFGFFKLLFPKYEFSLIWLLASEFICNMNAIIGLIFMIIIGKKIHASFPIFILIFPILFYFFYEFNIVNNISYWFFVYFIILILLLIKFIKFSLIDKRHI